MLGTEFEFSAHFLFFNGILRCVTTGKKNLSLSVKELWCPAAEQCSICILRDILISFREKV